MGGSPNVTPGCVVSVPGQWNDTQLWAANFFVPGKELGGFSVSVNGIACAVHNVGPERLVFWMPLNAPLGDYSAIVKTPTGMKSIAMHVVEAAPTLHAVPTGVSGSYGPISGPPMRSIGADGVINLPQDGSSVVVMLRASGLNPAANLEREVRFIRMKDYVETRFPVLHTFAPGGANVSETVHFILSSIPSGDYQIALRVGTEFSQPENLTIHGPDFQGNPIPTLSSLSPSSIPEGSQNFSISVFGTNFVNGSVVRWNGVNRSTLFVNPNELKAEISAVDVAVQGVAGISVFNPQPNGGLSSSMDFTISPPRPRPTVRINDATIQRGQNGAVTIDLIAAGGENCSRLFSGI